MLVAIYQIELYLPQCRSLKEKRYVVQSLKTRIRQKFNCSVAEVDGLDKWQKVVLGLSAVSNDRKLLEQQFEKTLDLVEADGRSVILETSLDFY